MFLSSTRFIHRAAALLTAVALLASTPLHATIDDAHSFAMEAAMPFVEQGFIVREDYWNGEVKSGQKLMVRHQMFKGNEYAFWLGAAQEDIEFELKVLDEKGKEIELDFKSKGMYATVRVNPPKTGTYSVVFSLTSKKEKSVYWALAYGYR
ncbi:hypothetical protein SAMN02745166_04535 [Prosthecobacter debontii]|uniref:Uncharacterized protein n=1 Tax=Prosthecobacter debontii TaxID=48467 RepID=A0A1T4YYQ6_9BACT|nr:hypothetical protein [Prosthecobacter debontii]SKB06773.1 hypothetical protein SAMN02745166_04535 [Prosthecobacter debontii]